MKGKKGFAQKLLGFSQDQINYVPYTDYGGNVLEEDDILFVYENEDNNKQMVEIWGEEESEKKGLTIHSPGVSYIFDEAGNFPIALRSQEGEVAYLKVSKKTGEILPYHAGCCPVKSLIAVGPSASAKTVYTLQLTDPAFHDALARDTEFSLEDDLPSEAPGKRKYEKAREELKQGILPEPSKRNENINYFYYVRYGGAGAEKSVLLKIEDIDGEQCTDMRWKSKIFQSNFLILTIGADEIVAGERGEPVQYPKVLDQLLPKLRVLREEKDYEILVTITKSDYLDAEHPYLEGAYENSIRIVDGKLEQVAHAKGFNYDVFNQRSRCVQKYLRKECPNFYNKLVNTVPKENLTFCMIASIGEECVENRFENYRPFCIDEPILSILTRAGMYPVAANDRLCEPQKVRGYTNAGLLGNCKKILGAIVDTILLEDDFEEEEV